MGTAVACKSGCHLSTDTAVGHLKVPCLNSSLENRARV